MYMYKDRSPLLPNGNIAFKGSTIMEMNVDGSGDVRMQQAALRKRRREDITACQLIRVDCVEILALQYECHMILLLDPSMEGGGPQEVSQEHCQEG